jgi:hypothetical protein
MSLEAMLIALCVLAAAGGFFIALLLETDVAKSRTKPHAEPQAVVIEELSRARVDERAWPAP